MSPVPCFAAEMDPWSGPFYAACTSGQMPSGEQLVVWMPHPTMSEDVRWAYHWVTAAEADIIERPHAHLTPGSRAQLLFLVDVDPFALDDPAAMAAIDAALGRCGCDLVRCEAEVTRRLAEYSEADEALMRACVARARQLSAVSA